ncbi:MAG: hypothetical protein M3Y25_05850 [Thermoproteota archaeon]|nr:hypothetical protein [Thermoproteota archaeon]
MATWSLSIFQIISTLIGSGFTIFLLNSIAADFNQPIIDIDVTSEELNRYLESQQMNDYTLPKSSPINQTLTNNSQFNYEEKFDTLVINNGRSAATNLVLQLSYPQGKILDYYTSFQSENISFQLTSPHLLIAKIDRMPKDAIMDIHTIVKCDLNANDINHTSFINDNDRLSTEQPRTIPCPPKINHIVTASYDQGSIFHTDGNYQPIILDKSFSLHSKNQLMIIIVTIVVVSFLMVFLYKRIHRFRIRLSRPKYVFNIVKEVIAIRDILQFDINSKKIFPLDLWITKSKDEKLRVFSNYDDYRYLDDFYTRLKERDEFMLKSFTNELLVNNVSEKDTTKSKDEKLSINSTANNQSINIPIDIQQMNRVCLDKANKVIEKIDWKRYQEINDKKYYTPIALAMTIAAAILISFIFEFYRVAAFQMLSIIPSPLYLILSVIVRGILFYILATEIINFKILFSYEVGMNNNILSFLIIDTKAKMKLLILSLLIGGIPFLWFLSDFHPFAEEIYLFSTNPLSGYKLYATAAMIDVALFLLLVMIVPKYLIKEKITRI